MTAPNSAAQAKSDPVFISDDSEIFLARKLQVETPLGLNHLAGTDFGRGPRDRPADVGIIKVGRKIKCVAKRTSPSRTLSEFPQRALTVGCERRRSASSMMSS